ncbi:MAG: ATP-binding cassette domain-containing protein [Lachnospiraceae bacterium]|jgi:ABC-2 type transport system ATP-binding protein|uniref:ABC transporter ATP-binding protein n=1 Tax=Candidatus Merdisoma sp. JLR.KK006 TaxID=3112626 RepID=UPI002FF35824|nr:ATP-binding cassette domain-containing protein [Lachnospiraceae bacterium]
MKTIMEVDSVEKSYGSAQVINHCSFRLREGETYGLLGVNGAGKTTLMKLILGLQRMDNGRISILGNAVSRSPEYLCQIGSMIENPVFYEHLNAEELLTMHLSYMGAHANLPEVLGLVGLEHAGKKPVSQYSLGMKQRLAIARAIIHRPRVLLLDEPLNGLDPIAITEMRKLLKKLTREGIAILLSSHIIGEVRHTADRVGILSGGFIKEEFSVEEKAARYGDQFEDYVVAQMISSNQDLC